MSLMTAWLGAAAVAWLAYCYGSRHAARLERENEALQAHTMELQSSFIEALAEIRRLRGKPELRSAS